MQANDIKLKNKREKKKTVGRGGKKGTYSGRGCKGQKARSGASVDPLFEGGRSTLIDHMKKKRGFTSRKTKPVVVKFSEISKKYENGSEVTVQSLINKGVLKKAEALKGVKIVGPKDKKINFAFSKEIKLTESVKK